MIKELLKVTLCNASDVIDDESFSFNLDLKFCGRKKTCFRVNISINLSNAIFLQSFSDRSRYYGISMTWVDWTSMIYMILYIPLVFPGSWILDKLVSTKFIHLWGSMMSVNVSERSINFQLKQFMFNCPMNGLLSDCRLEM